MYMYYCNWSDKIKNVFVYIFRYILNVSKLYLISNYNAGVIIGCMVRVGENQPHSPNQSQSASHCLVPLYKQKCPNQLPLTLPTRGGGESAPPINISWITFLGPPQAAWNFFTVSFYPSLTKLETFMTLCCQLSEICGFCRRCSWEFCEILLFLF